MQENLEKSAKNLQKGQSARMTPDSRLRKNIAGLFVNIH